MRTAWKIASVVVVAALLVGAGAFWWIRQPRTAEAEVVAPTAVAALGSIEETVSATGSVNTERQAALAFETGGPIAEVMAESGQQVEAGQLLARLDTA